MPERLPSDGPPRRPGPPPSLTVEAIAAAAVAIADSGGLDALTMRSLATGLGLSAAGLYRYVRSRDEVLGHMVDQVSAQVVHPPPTGDWVADLTDVARQQVQLLRAHPWMTQATATLRHLGPAVLDHLDWGLAVLSGVQASTRVKLEAIALVNGAAALFATAGQPAGPEAFAALDPHRHPQLTMALSSAPATTPSPDLFDRVVDGLLHGILDASSP